MAGRRYVHVPKALVDKQSPAAAAYLASLYRQRLRHGLPARRRLGRARALATRAPLPVASLVRKLPGRERPDLDRLLADLASSWPFPGRAPALSALALEARAGLTVFVFGEGPEPLLVAKLPGDRRRLELERSALDAAAPAAVAPRFLGCFGDAYVQEAIAGEPLPVAAEPSWLPEHADVAAGLARLAAATRRSAVPEQLREPLDVGHVSRRARGAVAEAEHALRGLDASVLQHGDTSPQNCLVRDGRLAGIVDWEQPRFVGTPGFDVWNLAVSSIEHGLALTRGSDAALVSAFRAAWRESRFISDARAAARATALAAGVSAALVDPLEVVFFARRVHVRLLDRDRFPTGPEVATQMLETVCAR